MPQERRSPGHPGLDKGEKMGFFSSALDLLTKGAEGFLTDLPAMAGQFGLGQLTSQIAGESSARQAERAFERSQGAYSTRYQTTMQDMRKAGLNPILASSGGFSVGNSPQMAAPQAFQAPAPVVLPSSHSAKNVAEVGNIEEDTRKKIEEQKNIVQQTNKLLEEQVNIFEDTIKKRKEQNVLDAQEVKTYQETLNLVQDFQIKLKQVQKISEEIELTKAQTGTSRAQTAELYALEKQARQKTKELAELTRQAQYKADEDKAVTNIYRGIFGNIAGGMKAAVKTFIPFIP